MPMNAVSAAHRATLQPATFAQIVGVWLLMFAGALLPPIFVSLIYRDGELLNFSTVFVGMVLLGLVFRKLGKNKPVNLRVRDGFVLVVLIWLLSCVLGSIMFITNLHMGLADALFESASALTTTGATVISGLDHLPPTILFFRQEMQWLGGIGVVVSAVALMPMLGVGGMQLFKAEAPGPVKDEKLAPKIAHTASILWKIYIGLTVACALAYWFAGMSVFDAVSHSMSTVSTGGFSTHDASLGYFDSTLIELVAVVFMLLGSINFGVHFAALRELDIRRYRDNEEVVVFFAVVMLVVLIVSFELYFRGDVATLGHGFRLGIFTVTSVITSTGFGIENFALWGGALPILLILISFVGGCGGSTAGGMKVVRFILTFKSIGQELKRLIHPKISSQVSLQGKEVDHRVMEGVRVFVSTYTVIFFILMLLLMWIEMDLDTAFSAVATTMNNLGPGLGDIASSFQGVSAASKYVLTLSMLLGRLEIFSLLVLLTPRFWKT